MTGSRHACRVRALRAEELALDHVLIRARYRLTVLTDQPSWKVRRLLAQRHFHSHAARPRSLECAVGAGQILQAQAVRFE
jgi:hypothetical protein